jgi:hypothetical protein
MVPLRLDTLRLRVGSPQAATAIVCVFVTAVPIIKLFAIGTLMKIRNDDHEPETWVCVYYCSTYYRDKAVCVCLCGGAQAGALDPSTESLNTNTPPPPRGGGGGVRNPVLAPGVD